LIAGLSKQKKKRKKKRKKYRKLEELCGLVFKRGRTCHGVLERKKEEGEKKEIGNQRREDQA